MKPLKIATRRSALALWQANHVRDLLMARHDGLQVELVPIVTRGDRILDRPLAEIGGKGLFLKELEQCLLDGGADLAVHSMKDMPAGDTQGLLLDVALPRANPWDALVAGPGTTLENLPAGSRVGTSSLRRQSQLLAVRPDLEVVPLRGNVDTRLRKQREGEYEAIILACAGLERLGLQESIAEQLAAPAWLPAATQGIIGIQRRLEDDETAVLISSLADEDAAVQAAAERAVSEALQGSCQVPLAAFAELDGDRLRVSALVGMPDGTRLIRAADTGSREQARDLGLAVAQQLLDQGAQTIIDSLAAH